MEKKNNQEYLNFKEIQELIKLVKKSELNEFNLKNGDFKLEIKYKGGADDSQSAQAVTQVMAPVAAPAPVAPAPQQSAAATSPAPTNNAADSPSDDDKLITIKAPMIGTFYRSPSPDKPPYIAVGDTINVGSVICIIEAMKLFNEIESEVSGKVVKILVDDASPVEFDQPLFLVEPV